MNKTITVNIGGFVFHIEEEAYHTLRTYLAEIRSKIREDESREEIMADVESRIAEIFKERTGQVREVVGAQDVAEVVAVMGTPDAFADDEEGAPQQEDTSHSGNFSTRNSNRKVYRDEDDALVGGVCSGLGHFFRVDPIWLRVALVVLVLSAGTGVLLYIVLWAVIPSAKTTAEKLRMRGEAINYENIKKSVENEFAGFSNKSGEVKKKIKESSGKIREHLRSSNRAATRVLKSIVGFIFILIGFGLIIGFAMMIFAGEFQFFHHNSSLSSEEFSAMIFHGKLEYETIILSGCLLFGAPATSAFYHGARLLGNFKQKVAYFNLTMALLFSAGVGLAIYSSISVFSEISQNGESYFTEELIATKSSQGGGEVSADTLVVAMASDPYFSNFDRPRFSNSFEWLKVDGDFLINGSDIYVNCRAGDGENFEMEVNKESHGPKRSSAVQFAQNIRSDYRLSNDTLYLFPYLKTPKEDGFRHQEVTFEIDIPNGKTLILDSSTRRIGATGRKSKSITQAANGELIWDNN